MNPSTSTGNLDIGATDTSGSGAAVPLMLTELRLPTITSACGSNWPRSPTARAGRPSA